MAISVVCTGCQSKYSVPDSLAGKKAKCQKCGGAIIVPTPLEELPELEPLGDDNGLAPLDTSDDLFGVPLPTPAAQPRANPFGAPQPLQPAKPAGQLAANPYANAPLASAALARPAHSGASTGASAVTAIFATLIALCATIAVGVLLFCSLNPMFSLVMVGLGLVATIACLALGIMRMPGISWMVCGIYGLLCVLGFAKAGYDIATGVNKIRADVAARQNDLNNRFPPTASAPSSWQSSPPQNPVGPGTPTTPPPVRPEPRPISNAWTPPSSENTLATTQFDDWNVKPDPLPDWAKVGEGGPWTIALNDPIFDPIHLPRTLGQAIGFSRRVGGQETLEIWNLAERKKVGQFTGRNAFERGYTFSPDGKYIAGLIREGAEQSIQVWSVTKQQKVCDINPARDRFTKWFFDFNSPTSLVTMVERNEKVDLRLWKVPEGTEENAGGGNVKFDHPKNVVLSAGRRYLLQTSIPSTIAIWDLQTMTGAGQIRLPERGHFQGASFSPDGKSLLIGYTWQGPSYLAVCDVTSGTVKSQMELDNSNTDPFRGNFENTVLCGWLPDNEGWLTGTKVISSRDGTLRWSLPFAGRNGANAALLDSKQLLSWREENSSVIVELKPFPFEQMDKAVAAVEAGGLEIDAELPPLGKPDWSGVKELTWPAEGVAWNVTANPRPTFKQGAGNKAISLGTDRLQDVLFSDPQHAQAVVVDIDNKSPENQEVSTKVRSRMTRYDLYTGKAASQTKVAGGSRLFAVSPTGQKAVLAIGQEDGRLDLYSLADTAIHVSATRPYAEEVAANSENHWGKQHSRQSVSWAGFVDEDHLLTLNHLEGQLVLWKLPEWKAVYRVRTGSKGRGSLSPGRKYLVVNVGSQFRFLEAMSGEVVGELPIPFEPLSAPDNEGSLAFSPDGQRFAGVVGDIAGAFLATYDLKTGKPITELPIGFLGNRAQWVGLRQLLTFGAPNSFSSVNLVDLDRRAIAWRFAVMGGYKLNAGPDDRLWMVADGRGESDRVLVAEPFAPGPDVKTAVASLPMNPAPIFGPGASISIDYNGIGGFGGADLPEKAKAQLTTYLQTRGVRVVDGAPLRLVGSVSGGKSRTEDYRSMGFRVDPNDRSFSITFTEQNLQLQLIGSDGKPLWESKSSSYYGGGGFSVRIPEGKGAQQYLQEQEQESHKRNLSNFFMGQRLPYIIYPQPKDAQGMPGLGQSMVNLMEFSNPNGRNGPIARPTPTKSEAQLAVYDMYTELLAANQASWLEHWKWSPDLGRPVVALRWGVGVQMEMASGRDKEELRPQPANPSLLRDLERTAGPVGPALVQMLRDKTAEGKFGTFAGATDSDLREVVILGGGERTQLAAAAKKAAVDMVLLIKIDAIGSGRQKDHSMVLQMLDMGSGKKIWESESQLSSKVAEAKIKGKDLTASLVKAMTEYVDTKLTLSTIDAITANAATIRAEGGTLHRGNPMASLAELMLYQSRNLITKPVATAAYTKLLTNAGDAAKMAGDDEAARDAVIKKYATAWQNRE